MVNHTYDDQDRDVAHVQKETAARQFTGRDDPSAEQSKVNAAYNELQKLKLAALNGAPPATRVTNRPAADNDAVQMILSLQAQLEVAEQHISDAQQEYEYAAIKLSTLQNIRQALRSAYDTLVPTTQQGSIKSPAPGYSR